MYDEYCFEMEHTKVLKNLKSDIWKTIPNREKLMSVIR